MSIRFYTTEQLGPTRSRTPEGYLLCENVPIARIGTLVYGPNDGIPVEAGKDGLITIQRTEDEVFKPSAILSFAGKPVTNDHPDEPITVDNYGSRENNIIGTVLHPRVGDGSFKGFVVADLLIYKKDAIDDIEAGKREVSAGYDAEYEQHSPGFGSQHDIIGNHVALVTKGRCGARCAIGDSIMPKSATFMDRIRNAFKTQDEGALENALADMPTKDADGDDNNHHIEINIHHHPDDDDDRGTMMGEQPSQDAELTGMGGDGQQVPGGAEVATGDEGAGGEGISAGEQRILDAISKLDARISALEAVDPDDDGDGDVNGVEPGAGLDAASDEPPDEPADRIDERQERRTDDRAGAKDRRTVARDRQTVATQDSAGLQAAFGDVLAKAEILAPGMKLPTFDAALPKKTTFDAMCLLRRRALKAAMANDSMQDVIESVAGTPTLNLKSMTCDAVTTVFNASAALARQVNNQRVTSGGTIATARDTSTVAVPTPRDMNARNAEFWAKR